MADCSKLEDEYIIANGAKTFHLSQLLKGAVVVTLCQNEADVKCQMDIDSSILEVNSHGDF